MKTPSLDTLVKDAVTAGVLPADADVPSTDSRPWPVVLLTALGAWLAALPLLGVVGLLLGDIVRRGPGPYAVGVLVLAGALVVLRSRSVPLFVEQLAVPALLVGTGSLSFGLFRDLSVQAGAVVLAVVMIGIAAAVARPWLRVLLGAAASALLAIASTPEHSDVFRAHAWRFWLSWQLVLALWMGAGAAQPTVPPRVGALLESLLAGGLLATLAALAWWSGSTLLIGAGSADLLRELAHARQGSSHAGTMQGVSALLALGSAAWLARRWPSVRRAWCAGAALVGIALAWFMPALGAVLWVLAWCAASRRWRLATAAAVAAAWIVGSFYYQLAWPLATKAVVLAVAGALLGALAWLAPRAAHDVPDASLPATRPSWFSGIALSALAVLAVANAGIWQKEQLIAHGAPVFVELAPVDPRSLMQGDYMRLNFRLPANARDLADEMISATRPHVIARRDSRGIATLVRRDDGTPLAADEMRIELTPKNGTWVLVSDAWFFREGEADRWSRAKYGEFRVDPSGRALLVGLRGPELAPL